MKPLILFILLSGCATTYEIKKCTAPDVCSYAKIKSYREFPEGLTVDYSPEKVKVKADKVVQQPNPLEDIGKQVIEELLKRFPLDD